VTSNCYTNVITGLPADMLSWGSTKEASKTDVSEITVTFERSIKWMRASNIACTIQKRI